MITDIVLLSCVGIRCVLVHGGGPEINTWLDRVGIKPEFKNGLRVTDGGWGTCCLTPPQPEAEAEPVWVGCGS